MQGYSDRTAYLKASIPDSFTKRDKEFAAGLRVWDISKPAEPREIGFMPVDGLGLHRLWYVGGRYAYASCHWQSFTDHALAVIDPAQPPPPQVCARLGAPRRTACGSETPSSRCRALAVPKSPRPRPRPKKTIATKQRTPARTTCPRTAPARSRASS